MGQHDPVTGDRLMLLDAPSLYFRAFYGIPATVRAPDGTPVNAVRGLLDMAASLLRAHPATHLVACLDADWRPEFRVALLPQYKAHRVGADGGDQVPDGLGPQVPIMRAVLAALGIATLGVAGYEADDVIATLADTFTGAVDVVTGDRDLFQLVDDARGVRVLYTARGVAHLEVITESEVSRRYGIPGRAYGEFAILRGDPSDGLPGVAGVGDKTAATLITRHGSARAAADAEARLRGAAGYIAAAEKVVRVVHDVPVPALDTRLPSRAADAAALADLAERWSLTGPVQRLKAALAWDDG